MKYNMSRVAITLLLAIVLSASKQAEEPAFLFKIKSLLHNFIETVREEKIYLSTDKTLYRQGEYIWFTVFLSDATTGKPNSASDVAYAELYDMKGSLLQKIKLHVNEGVAGGEFYIDETRPGGIYTIKSYTSWMANPDLGSESCFSKEIIVQKLITPRLLLKPDFEKKAYGPGDRVCLKLIVTDLNNEKACLAAIQSAVYLDGKLLTEFESETDCEGKADLSFKLPDELSSIDGLIRASVKYRGTEESVSRAVPIVLNKIDLNFYPEGGTWVSGVAGRMAFEALNEFGTGADVSGDIIDDHGAKVGSFESFHNGMGAFELKPEEGKRYSARITRPRGNDKLFELPLSVAGYSLNLKRQDNRSVLWTVNAPEAGRAYLAVRVHGDLCIDKMLNLKAGHNQLEINTEELPAGIAVFTLFDSKGSPRCERLLMTNLKKRLNINIKTDRKVYAPGEEVSLTVETADEQGRPVPAKLSLAVVDEQTLTAANDKQDNIMSYMLLSSELKGKVHEPSFYFDPDEKKAEESMDYLLLTHGWRRFTWKDVVDGAKLPLMAAETAGDVYGYVIDSEGKAKPAEVTAVELENKKRTMTILTSPSGQFVFRKLDISSPVMLLVKSPYRIMTIDRPDAVNLKRSIDTKSKTSEVPEAETVEITKDEANTEAPEQEALAYDKFMVGGEQSLDESIVVGYGTQMRKVSAGSISRIYDTQYLTLMSSPGLMAGLIAGVSVQPRNVNAGDAEKILIRGVSTFASGNAEPLTVFDGVPMLYGSDDYNHKVTGSIASIDISKGSSSASTHVPDIANGVIVMNSQKSYFPHYRVEREKPKYNYLIIPAATNEFHSQREFYSLMPRKLSADSSRVNFGTTVYWMPDISTGANGKAELKYYCNDAASVFRITAEGLSKDGLVGRVEYRYSSRNPLSLDVKLPDRLGFGDTLLVPVSVRNNTDERSTVTVTLKVSSGLAIASHPTLRMSIEAGEAATALFTVVSTGVRGESYLELFLQDGKGCNDAVRQTISINPVGFPRNATLSGSEYEKNGIVEIKDCEQGSLKAIASLHVNLFDDLFADLHSLLREPSGCFEQVSSTTFPNIYILKFMQATNSGNESHQKHAVELLQRGYAKLAGYESKGGGFEWYGGWPAHEALTAYGLMQFAEMQNFITVDKAMIARAKAFLKGRQRADGSFEQHRGKYGFSGAAEVINNAYIAYALAETGDPDDKAYKLALAEAEASRDMYRLALLANASACLKQWIDYHRLIKYFKSEGDDLDRIKVQGSVVHSSTAKLEAIALWAAAIMKAAKDSVDIALAESCIKHITGKRGSYGFGSTQATTLSLKALTDFACLVPCKQSARMILTVNGSQHELRFDAKSGKSMLQTSFADKLIQGSNEIKVRFDSLYDAVAYSALIAWNALTPKNSGNCPLSLAVSLSHKSVKVNETVRLSVNLNNLSKSGQPMSMAVVGIPAGLSPQPWQLKELQEKGVFDFYELIDGRLAIYYRELGSYERKTVNLDLKADIPGRYTGAASSGYLYYNQEDRDWKQGLAIMVIP